MRKRSTYRPRPRLVDPVALALELSAKLTMHDQTQLRAIVRQAYDGLRTGTHPGAAWRQLADALNIAEQLCHLGIASDSDSRSRIAKGQEALAAVHRRQAIGSGWTLYPVELTALETAVWMHEVQLQHASKGEFERAHHLAAERVRQARTGNAPTGAMVCVGGVAA